MRRFLKVTMRGCRHIDMLIGCRGTGCAFLFVILAGFLGAGCLDLEGHKRQSDAGSDEVPHGCAGVSCWEPPPTICAENDALEVYAPSGYCSGGECFYANGQVSCHGGLCDEGVCVDTPCQGVTCFDPPEAFCTDADRTIYSPSGYCEGGRCEYATRTITCEAVCQSGACVDSPCAEVFCRKPPASYCEDDSNLRVFAPEGRCVVVEGSPACLHDSQLVSCVHGCGDGRCQDDPCAGVVCDFPPARYCDGAVLVLFEPYGVCDENGFCIYTEQRHPCIEPCVDAHCGEDDACTWVTCDKPPAPYCTDTNTLRVYDRDGLCQEGFCSYASRDLPCTGGCEEGHCKNDPCLGVSCDKPTAAHCDGKVLVDFAQSGSCDKGVCSYADNSTTCSYDCRDGACVTEDTNAVTWISIVGGTFEMGSFVEPDEQPVHTVDVPSFEMTRSEITVDQYMTCVTEGLCTEPSTWSEECYWNREGFGSFPVNCVSWDQAATFCEWIGGSLPSEAQWEYAARSAGKDITYSWGDEAPSCDYAIFNEGGAGCGTGLSWQVCSKPAGNTDQGLCDMAGNLMEWVQDTRHDNYEGAPADGGPWEGGSSLRMTRGSCYASNPDQMRSADRGPYFDPKNYTNVFLGVRCIREVQ